MLVEPAQTQQRTRFQARSSARLFAFLTLALLLAVGSLGAQAMESLVVGARIRVRVRDTTVRAAGERQFTARFDGVATDTLAVCFAPGTDHFLLPLSALKSLDVSVSRRSAGRGALVGAGYGVLVGASVTAVFLARVSGRGCEDCWISSEVGVLINAVPLTVLTSAITAIIFSRRQDKWRRVPLDSLVRRN